MKHELAAAVIVIAGLVLAQASSNLGVPAVPGTSVPENNPGTAVPAPRSSPLGLSAPATGTGFGAPSNPAPAPGISFGAAPAPLISPGR